MLPMEHHFGFALIGTDMGGQKNEMIPPTVLVVEDNLINQRIAKLVLAAMSVNVIVAGNGAEALAKLKEAHVSIILMDCQMPIMDGLEASRMIRELEKQTGGHIPIIAVTALSNRDECIAAGMDDHILKPISSMPAVRKLELWLSTHRPS